MCRPERNGLSAAKMRHSRNRFAHIMERPLRAQKRSQFRSTMDNNSASCQVEFHVYYPVRYRDAYRAYAMLSAERPTTRAGAALKLGL